jgi:hypothetical protein
MTPVFELARRAVRLRAISVLALICTLSSCKDTDPLTPTPAETSDESGTPEEIAAPSLTSSFRGGIPFGTFRLPTSEFGTVYDGAMRNIYPQYLLRELAAIKARGGKVVLMFAGHEHYYKTNGYFSLSKWKARVNRFRNVNFSSYVRDGTIIGHYLIDEPNDRRNWRGRPVPPATLEEMAKYSKQLWPGMATVVRTWPAYLASWNRNYRYLDAAWAQYEIHRFPNVRHFISSNVATAKAKGLALIVGMNIIHGGTRRRTEMTASQVRSYGLELLSNSYPCAFISWQYRDYYMRSGSIREAMRALSARAKNRGFKTCEGSSGGGGGGDDDDDDDDRDDDD